MSLKSEKIKKTILKGISVNPTDIEIKETFKIEKDGAFEEIEETRNITVVIYKERSNDLKISSDKIGTSYSNKNYSMIADYSADLKSKSSIGTYFESKEGCMKILNINPIIIKEVICGYECSLERVD